MKKFSFLTLALVTCFGALAQNTDDDKAHKPVRTAMAVQPRLGIKAGINMADMKMDDEAKTTDFKTSGKTSAHFGLFANIPLGGTLRFQPEILYSMVGAKYTETTTTTPPVSTVYEEDLDYVTVPLMLQIQTPSGFLFEFGPQFGILANAQRDKGGVNVEIKDQRKSVDVAANVGLGYLTRIGLGLGARYNYGLSNVFNKDDAPASQSKYNFSNNVIQFGLTYQFGAYK
jgi:hypothetical protein